MRQGLVRTNTFFPAVVLAFLTGCATLQVTGEGEAALVLEDILAQHGSSRLKAQTSPPMRSTVSYTVQGHAYQGDLYQSAQGSLAGIVLVPGLAPQGKDDPRLSALAITLARARFTVLVPDVPSLRAYQVRASNVREVADAFAHLVSRLGSASQRRAGIGGFSYAAGPAVLAALEPDIREQVDFVLSVGGYHDLRSVAVFLTTGYFREEIPGDGRKWQHAETNSYARQVLALNLAERATGQPALKALLNNTDPEKALELIKRLPAPALVELGALNPAQQDLSGLKANFILLHGRGDDFIPYTQSLDLARALPANRARLFLIDGLAHVDIRPQSQDLPALLQAVETLLFERAGPH